MLLCSHERVRLLPVNLYVAPKTTVSVSIPRPSFYHYRVRINQNRELFALQMVTPSLASVVLNTKRSELVKRCGPMIGVGPGYAVVYELQWCSREIKMRYGVRKGDGPCAKLFEHLFLQRISPPLFCFHFHCRDLAGNAHFHTRSVNTHTYNIFTHNFFLSSFK